MKTDLTKHELSCCVLVTSCDKYEDAWYPFFELWHQMWPDCPYPIYLNTETKEYSHEGLNITCLHPDSLHDKKGEAISWSNRLKQVLKKIDTEYILFSLEDFFLMSPVRADMVENCLEWMDREKDIAVVDFFHDLHEEALFNNEFSLTDKTNCYAMNTMIALWRKDFLLSILRDESPLDFEYFGTQRWKRTKQKIYTHREEFPPVFDYQIRPWLGYGIHQGKWLHKNKDLFEEHNIAVDFSKRGFLDNKENHIKKENEEQINGRWFIREFVRSFKSLSPRLFIQTCVCLKIYLKTTKPYRRRLFKAKFLNW